MTEQDWKKVETALSSPYGRISLQCDEFKLTLKVVQTGPLRFAIFPFVNDEHKGEWGSRYCEERRRFFCPEKKYVNSPTMRTAIKELRASAKKLNVPNMKLPDPDETITVYTPFWTDFKKLKRHLIANNKQIDLIINEPESEDKHGVTQNDQKGE
jgi:hypothetical protein